GGLSDGQVGLVFAAILAGNALVSIAVGLAGDRIGRRRAYVLLLFVMSAAGVAYALSDSVVVLVLVALTGTLSTDAIASVDSVPVSATSTSTTTESESAYATPAALITNSSRT